MNRLESLLLLEDLYSPWDSKDLRDSNASNCVTSNYASNRATRNSIIIILISASWVSIELISDIISIEFNLIDRL